jgi:hypothetical protein
LSAVVHISGFPDEVVGLTRTGKLSVVVLWECGKQQGQRVEKKRRKRRRKTEEGKREEKRREG